MVAVMADPPCLVGDLLGPARTPARQCPGHQIEGLCGTLATRPASVPDRSGPLTAHEGGPLADDGARSDLADLMTIDFDDEQPIEDQVDIGAFLALAHEVLAFPIVRNFGSRHRS